MTDPSKPISHKTVARLCQYRRLLSELAAEGVERSFSHEIAGQIGVSAPQVRRDIMELGYSGTPKEGYEVAALIANINTFLGDTGDQRAALVGVGNLGQALLSYFEGRGGMRIAAAFDVLPERCGERIEGCPCYPADEAE